jgi:hypothetical protein
MNMQQALERLKTIAEAQGQAALLTDLLARRPKEAPHGVTVQSFNPQADKYDQGHGRYCVIDADLLQDAIKKTADRHAAEAAKLQPVIDMAEAALKGILATGDTK